MPQLAGLQGRPEWDSLTDGHAQGAELLRFDAEFDRVYSSTVAPMLLQETGADYEDKIVRPITRTRIRDNAVYYEAIALYSTKRDEFQTEERGLSLSLTPVNRKGSELWDAQIGYDFSESGIESLKGLRVSLQGQNLTDD